METENIEYIKVTKEYLLNLYPEIKKYDSIAIKIIVRYLELMEYVEIPKNMPSYLLLDFFELLYNSIKSQDLLDENKSTKIVNTIEILAEEFKDNWDSLKFYLSAINMLLSNEQKEIIKHKFLTNGQKLIFENNW